jgi:ubiquinone biosynthesis protein COQ4
MNTRVDTSPALSWVFDRSPCQPTTPIEIPRAAPRRRVRWRRALRSLRELIADPDSTGKALDLTYAVGQRDFERAFQRFVQDAEGQRLLASETRLADRLADRGALECLPEGSLGRSYLDYIDRNGYRPLALIELEYAVQQSWQAEGVPAYDATRMRFKERRLMTHDLHHVLTDYGTDGIGEATLLAFDLAQQGGIVSWLLNIGASLEILSRVGPRWLPYVLRAWRRGHRARRLILLPFEDLLALPLERVRAIASVEPSARAHPGGILRGVVA